MEYTIKDGDKSTIEITVTIPFDEFKPFLTKAAEHLSQESKIEGFRPGKAPYDVVKQRVGEMNIYNHAAEDAIKKNYVEIVSKEKIEVIGSPEINITKIAPDNDLEFSATVPKIPEVTVGDYKTICVKEKKVEIKDEQIMKVIEDLRKQRAQEVIEDKAVENGDKVEMDFDVFRDNVPIENGSSKNFPLIVGDGQFIPGFEENLAGMKPGEEKDFKLKFPKDYGAKQLAGKEHDFHVKINSVYKRSLPEVNDEFAAGFGFDTLDKFKEQIKQNLEQEEQQKDMQRVELEMLEQLVDKSKFGEIPDVLVNSEIHKMINELESNIAQQGLKFDDYLKQIGKSMDQLKLDFAPQAIKRVKTALISRTLFFQENMKVSEEEVTKQIDQVKQIYAQNPDMAQQFETPEYREYVENILGNQKVMEFLKEHCIEKV